MQTKLTAEKENELVSRAQHGSIAAQNELVMIHKGLVGKIAKRYSRLNAIGQEDLFAYGIIGFISAIAHYSLAYNRRFLAFAGSYVRAEILDHAIGNFSQIKIATNNDDRKVFFRLRKERATLTARMGFDPSAELLADRIKVPVATVEYMQNRFDQPIVSMDSQAIGLEGSGMSLHDTLSNDANPEATIADHDAIGFVQRAMVEFEQIGLTSDLEREIWNHRIACDDDSMSTCQALSDRLGYSKQGINKIEMRLRDRFVAYAKENDSNGTLD